MVRTTPCVERSRDTYEYLLFISVPFCDQCPVEKGHPWQYVELESSNLVAGNIKMPTQRNPFNAIAEMKIAHVYEFEMDCFDDSMLGPAEINHDHVMKDESVPNQSPCLAITRQLPLWLGATKVVRSKPVVPLTQESCLQLGEPDFFLHLHSRCGA